MIDSSVIDSAVMSLWLFFVCAWPLIAGLVHTILYAKAKVNWLPLTAAMPALMTVLLVDPTDSVYAYHFLLGGHLALDQTAHVFMLFSSILWFVSSFFAFGYVEKSKQSAFFLFYCLSMSGNFSLILSQDILTFYFGYALMSFAFYGIFFSHKTDFTTFAARVYICFTVISEMCIFAAFVLLESSIGVTQFSGIQAKFATSPLFNDIMVCAFVGFGIKTGFIGLHSWLPLAHSASPISASAVLAGAIAKAGILGWIRILPPDGSPIEMWGNLMVVLGIAAAFYGVIIGLTQNKLKPILAYSTVSQLGIVTILIGMHLLLPMHRAEIIFAITLYVMHHGLNKGALFLGTGQCDKGKMPNIVLWGLLCIPALSLAGLPLTSGMFAKVLLKTHVQALSGWMASAWLAQAMPTIVTLTSFSTAALVTKFLYLCYPDRLSPRAKPSHLPLISWLTLLAASQLGVWLMYSSDIDWSLAKQAKSLGPILLGIVVGILVTRSLRKVPPVPLGDILYLVIKPASLLKRADLRKLTEFKDRFDTKAAQVSSLSKGVLTLGLGRVESLFLAWPAAIITVIIFIVIFSSTLFFA